MNESQTLWLSRLGARRRSDDDLIERALRGDAVAFSEVYRRYQKRIYGYCLARSLDPDAAADATQEVFIRLLHSEPGSISNPRAWLFTVARNLVIDASRKRARTPEDTGIEEESAAWDRLSAADTADEVLSRSDARDVFLALRTLRPRYRTAIVMRDVHGESAQEMAEALETTPGAVDTLVSRARDSFAHAYASVRDLPAACRASVELIYRQRGGGITDEEKVALSAHLAGCARCQAEASKAENPNNLAALLPFLVPAKRLGYALVDRAALALRSAPDAVAQVAPALSQPHTWNLAMKVSAGILAAAIVTAPVAVTMNRHSSSDGDRASASRGTSSLMVERPSGSEGSTRQGDRYRGPRATDALRVSSSFGMTFMGAMEDQPNGLGAAWQGETTSSGDSRGAGGTAGGSTTGGGTTTTGGLGGTGSGSGSTTGGTSGGGTSGGSTTGGGTTTTGGLGGTGSGTGSTTGGTSGGGTSTGTGGGTSDSGNGMGR
jgi:RNA polymerase sigma factor (sigma-70 family)